MNWVKLLNKYVCELLFLITIYCSININGKIDKWDYVLSADGKGYYAYLPAIFIYNDLTFSFIDYYENKYYVPERRTEFRRTHNGFIVNKYFCGESLLLVPTFFITHLFCKLTSFEADGYSPPYHYSIIAASLIYLFVGLKFLKKLLSSYLNNENLISVILFFFLFGTNLFFYATCNPSMSHVYSFSLITIFLFLLKRFLEEYKLIYFYSGIIIYSLIILIRPVNGIIIFILPFMVANMYNLKFLVDKILTLKIHFLIGLITFFLILSIQLLIWYSQTGSFVVWSYGENEGFNFTSPEIYNILFSYKKGLFVYTPLTLLSMTGLYWLFTKNKFQFFSLFIFLVLITYVLSSWWHWSYGMSFGLRAYIDYFSIFAILLAITLDNLKTNHYLRKIYLFLCLLTFLLCQVQTYQYRKYILHWDSMNKDKYWKVFLKTGKEYRGILWK